MVLLLFTAAVLHSSSGVARKLKGRPARDSGLVVTVDAIGNVIQAYRAKDQVYFSQSTDGGKSFGARVKVGDSSIFPSGDERLHLQAFSGKIQFFPRQIMLSWILSRNHPESAFGAVNYFSMDYGSKFTLDRFFGEKKPVPRETTHTSGGGIFSPFQDAKTRNIPVPDYIQTSPNDLYPTMPPDILGDLDGDIRTTPMDVAFLANSIFLGRPFPSRRHPLRNRALNPPDVNCDGTISPADLVVELRAVFLGITVSCP